MTQGHVSVSGAGHRAAASSATCDDATFLPGHVLVIGLLASAGLRHPYLGNADGASLSGGLNLAAREHDQHAHHHQSFHRHLLNYEARLPPVFNLH